MKTIEAHPVTLIAIMAGWAILGLAIGATSLRVAIGYPGWILEAVCVSAIVGPLLFAAGRYVANRAARADIAACAARCEAMRKAALHAERRLRNAGADASDIMCEIESADRQ